MKTIFCLVALFSGTVSHAAEDLNFEMLKLQSNESVGCLDAVEPVLVTVTHPSSLLRYLSSAVNKQAQKLAKETREAVIYNLSVYETWAKEAKQNAENGFSNSHIQKQIDQSIQAHASDTVLVFPVGKAIGACVRANINFNGTAAEQILTANAFLRRAEKIRKAVN